MQARNLAATLAATLAAAVVPTLILMALVTTIARICMRSLACRMRVRSERNCSQ